VQLGAGQTDTAAADGANRDTPTTHAVKMKYKPRSGGATVQVVHYIDDIDANQMIQFSRIFMLSSTCPTMLNLWLRHP